MCWPVGIVVAGAVERDGSMVMAVGWKISVAMAPSSLRILLWHRLTRPPKGQLRAWLVELCPLHPQEAGSPGGVMPYRR
jgi:hypothetical protein